MGTRRRRSSDEEPLLLLARRITLLVDTLPLSSAAPRSRSVPLDAGRSLAAITTHARLRAALIEMFVPTKPLAACMYEWAPRGSRCIHTRTLQL